MDFLLSEQIEQSVKRPSGKIRGDPREEMKHIHTPVYLTAQSGGDLRGKQAFRFRAVPPPTYENGRMSELRAKYPNSGVFTKLTGTEQPVSERSKVNARVDAYRKSGQKKRKP